MFLKKTPLIAVINNTINKCSAARPPTASLIVDREVTEASELANQAS